VSALSTYRLICSLGITGIGRGDNSKPATRWLPGTSGDKVARLCAARAGMGLELDADANAAAQDLKRYV
jgi:hypothetical protein